MVATVALEFGLLGPVRVSDDGRELDLGTPQQCAVLGMFLLAEGRAVSLEQVVDGLWGDGAPVSAAATVRTYLSRLRGVLPGDGPGSSIRSVRGGYRLSVPESLDLTEFDQRTRRARQARAAGDRLRAVAELRAGLALWRGEALGGAKGEYVNGERDRLQALRLLALQDRIALDIELGRHAEVLPELVTLTRLHPLQERWRQFHMLALYGTGRQADALQVYRDVHALLVSELGIEPGGELRALHGRILRTDPDLECPVPAPTQRLSFTPHTAPDGTEGPVTMPPTPGPTPPQRLLAGRLWAARQHFFVGRGAERALFASALGGAGQGFAVLYLYGPTGIGKSTLLRQLADDAAATHRPVVHVCGSAIGASVAAFTEAASQALSDPRAVLMIDAFERCGELEGWLRERFLPQLPEGVLVALTGRQPPEPAWRFDPCWSGALLVRRVGDLSRFEADQLLKLRGIPDGVRESVLAFAGGHPLALSRAADMARRCCDSSASSARRTDEVLQALVTELIDTVPSPDHRMALHVCAHADTTSEQLLRAVVPGNDPTHVDPAELYAWLRIQRFITSGPAGLYPNDTVRHMLDNALRPRDPVTHEDIHHKVAEFVSGSLAARAAARSTVEAVHQPVRRRGPSRARRSA